MFISEWQESLKQYFVVTSDAGMELISWKKKVKTKPTKSLYKIEDLNRPTVFKFYCNGFTGVTIC